jgi:REP element-mobilizing transposase RayT
MKIEFNNLYTHFVFITHLRQPVIPEKNRIEIEKYITGIVRNHESKLYSIYANPEHVHFLVSRAPTLSEVDLATIICDSSEKFINKHRLVAGHFTWQQSAAAFSVSKSRIDDVCKYILNQPQHHKHESFAQEYEYFLKVYQANVKIDKIGLWGNWPVTNIEIKK